MRELKFRAWKIRPDGKAEHWTCPPFGYEKNADDVAFTVGAGHTMNIKEFIRDADIIEQYTGLKDKNGKEIYEGDIFEDDYNGGYEVVKWIDERSAFCLCYMGYERDVEGFYTRYTNKMEVIGNIHENHELLEEK